MIMFMFSSIFIEEKEHALRGGLVMDKFIGDISDVQHEHAVL